METSILDATFAKDLYKWEHYFYTFYKPKQTNDGHLATIISKYTVVQRRIEACIGRSPL